MSYLFHEYYTASTYIEECRPKINFIMQNYHYPLYVLYDGLVALALVKQSDDKCKLRKIAEESLSKLKEMCETAPESFLNKYHLLQAEMAAVFNGESDVLLHYQKSISLSREHCFLQEEALACERAGMYCLESNLEEESCEFIQRSFDCYGLWGASAKMIHMQYKYGDILEKKDNPIQLSSKELLIEAKSQTSELSELTNIPCKNAAVSRKRKLS